MEPYKKKERSSHNFVLQSLLNSYFFSIHIKHVDLGHNFVLQSLQDSYTINVSMKKSNK
jgi:hypothetical protein